MQAEADDEIQAEFERICREIEGPYYQARLSSPAVADAPQPSPAPSPRQLASASPAASLSDVQPRTPVPTGPMSMSSPTRPLEEIDAEIRWAKEAIANRKQVLNNRTLRVDNGEGGSDGCSVARRGRARSFCGH